MIEKEITIESAGNRLSGMLCIPQESGKFPFVLMIHGTGPLDRDQNMPGQQLNIFNAIAHHLAGKGIASLRYDKRGCGKSSGDYYAAGNSDLINDAISAFDCLKELDVCNPDQVFLLGHSEGCIIAPQVSLKRPVRGLVLLCPFVDHMESILLKQAAQIQKEFEGAPGLGGLVRRAASRIMGMTVSSQQQLIDRLKSSTEDTFTVRGQKITAKSLRELMRLDPPAIFSQVTAPLLLIGGEKDLQCDPQDVDRIASLAQGPAEAHVIRDLTHVLRLDTRPATLLGSAELVKSPMEPTVLDLIARWLDKHCFQESITERE